jgi:hypothetical protein
MSLATDLKNARRSDEMGNDLSCTGEMPCAERNRSRFVRKIPPAYYGCIPCCSQPFHTSHRYRTDTVFLPDLKFGLAHILSPTGSSQILKGGSASLTRRGDLSTNTRCVRRTSRMLSRHRYLCENDTLCRKDTQRNAGLCRKAQRW